ncbi:MAG: hypothetical protein Q9P01_18995 [Anaerolineae bacterium]|nr:hypothetical protein [Anaerolineae bacterium]
MPAKLELGVRVVADWDVILAPATVQVRVILHEANSLMNTLRLLNVADIHSGLAEWLYTTANDMDDDRKMRNQIVADVVDHVAHVMNSSAARDSMSFLELIKDVEQTPVNDFREGMLVGIREKREDYPGDDALLASRESYIKYIHDLLAEKYAKKGHDFDDGAWDMRYDYIMNPQQLKDDSIEHLRHMWDKYLKAEWKRIKPTLQEAVDAFSQVDFSDMTAFEAIETVMGRNMRGKDDFETHIRQAEILTFVPSAHLGPYIGWGAFRRLASSYRLSLWRTFTQKCFDEIDSFRS